MKDWLDDLVSTDSKILAGIHIGRVQAFRWFASELEPSNLFCELVDLLRALADEEQSWAEEEIAAVRQQGDSEKPRSRRQRAANA